MSEYIGKSVEDFVQYMNSFPAPSHDETNKELIQVLQDIHKKYQGGGHQRLGQLISCAAHNRGVDPFHIEDHTLVYELKKLYLS